jgi:hypothetical protein
MRLFAVCAALTLAACYPLDPGGPNSDMKKSSGGSMCTSPACAGSPCTPGCVFQPKNGGCPCDAPSAVPTASVLSCSNRCGLRDRDGNETDGQAQSGYCWKLDENAPGCTYKQGGCQAYNAACYPTDNGFDTGGASMCAPDETCTDGGTVLEGDLSFACDMTTPPDLTTVPDLATSNAQGNP